MMQINPYYLYADWLESLECHNLTTQQWGILLLSGDQNIAAEDLYFFCFINRLL